MKSSAITMLGLAILVFSMASFSESAGEKKPSQNAPELKVQLRLNVIESSKLMERYGSLLDREFTLRDSVRACLKSGDERLPQYQQSLQEVRTELGQTKKKLITLETEKTKLVERIGAKNVPDGSLEQIERVNRVLEKILAGLQALDKRLEKLERRK